MHFTCSVAFMQCSIGFSEKSSSPMLIALVLAAACAAFELDQRIGTRAERPRGLQASDSASACDPATQRLALLQLYNNTNGASWTNSTGWPAATVFMSPMTITQFATFTPVTTSTCIVSRAVLPDHCCWYGVQCCTPQTCTTVSSQSCSVCSCTSGIIVGLSLGMNNVSISWAMLRCLVLITFV